MFRESIYKRYRIALNPPTPSVGGYWFIFSSSRILLNVNGGQPGVPYFDTVSEIGLDAIRTQYLGTFDGKDCFATEIPPSIATPAGMAFFELRSLWGVVDEDLYLLAGRALQIVSWDQANQYCGACGRPTEPVPGERAKRCPHCRLLFYPRLSPAVITAVTNGSKILLGHRAGMRNMYSIFAGFVELGETLEECLHREIFEEVGISVKNARYFGSQPWPYPNSLMIGFTAEYAGGDIKPDGVEISHADWYDAAHMPEIPPKLSIARELIDWFIEQHPV
jgi:NAD+ diphosphatase